MVREADPKGGMVAHARIVDTLVRMRRAGSITRAMHRAARDFQAHFAIAAYGATPSRDMVRVSGGGWTNDLTDNQIAARNRVARALGTLGGIGSPGGSCVWPWSGWATACAGGRCSRAGPAGPYTGIWRPACWLQRSVCWPSTTAMGRRRGDPGDAHLARNRATTRAPWELPARSSSAWACARNAEKTLTTDLYKGHVFVSVSWCARTRPRPALPRRVFCCRKEIEHDPCNVVESPLGQSAIYRHLEDLGGAGRVRARGRCRRGLVPRGRPNRRAA